MRSGLQAWFLGSNANRARLIPPARARPVRRRATLPVMARREMPDRPRGPGEFQWEVQTPAAPDSPGRLRRALTVVAGLCAAGALAALVVPAILTNPARPVRPVHAAAVPAGLAVGIPALDAIAAAFRGPLRCMSVSFAPADPDYLRAGPGPGTACAGYRSRTPVILRLVDGELRPLLDTATYSCPVPALPAAVQSELHVCPRAAPVSPGVTAR